MIEFAIKGQPVAKGRPRFSVHGNRAIAYTPAKTRAAEKAFLLQSMKYRPQKPISTPVELTLVFQMKMPKAMIPKHPCGFCKHYKRPDLDNLAKLVKDALNKVFWKDDSLVWKMNCTKYYVAKDPRTIVRIEGVT